MSPWAWVGVALLVLWVLGWAAFKIAGFFIHVLLIVGVALLVIGLVRRAATRF